MYFSKSVSMAYSLMGWSLWLLWRGAWQQEVRNGAVAVAEGLRIIHEHEAYGGSRGWEGRGTRNGVSLWNFKTYPVTQLFQQSTPPSILPDSTSANQVFTRMSLWGPFSPKASQWACSKPHHMFFVIYAKNKFTVRVNHEECLLLIPSG